MAQSWTTTIGTSFMQHDYFTRVKIGKHEWHVLTMNDNFVYVERNGVERALSLKDEGKGWRRITATNKTATEVVYTKMPKLSWKDFDFKPFKGAAQLQQKEYQKMFNVELAILAQEVKLQPTLEELDEIPVQYMPDGEAFDEEEDM